MGIKQTVEQNVVIWLLGTLAVGFSAGFGAYETILRVSGGGFSEAPAEQLWISLRGIDFDSSVDVVRYRVVIRADGVPFSYPGHSVWKAADPKVPDQDFPLRSDRAAHEFQFELFYEDSGGEAHHAVGQKVTEARAGAHNGSYQVFLLGGITRAGRPSATIQYQVR